jgi:hypothetical protein
MQDGIEPAVVQPTQSSTTIFLRQRGARGKRDPKKNLGAQTGRRGGGGPAWCLLGGKDPTGRLRLQITFRITDNWAFFCPLISTNRRLAADNKVASEGDFRLAENQIDSNRISGGQGAAWRRA